MNEKFFDLPVAKQDRMVNGALEVFAKNGYKHASTDDMVKAVGVSKGLWFHYFGSKFGLYIFVFEYSIKHLLLELSITVNEEEKDFFEITKQIELTKLKLSKNYPYMMRFLEASFKEADEEIIEKTSESRDIIKDRVNSLIKNSEIKNIDDKVKRERLKKMTNYAVNGLVRDKMEKNIEPDTIYKEVKQYIDMFKMMSGEIENLSSTSKIHISESVAS